MRAFPAEKTEDRSQKTEDRMKNVAKRWRPRDVGWASLLYAQVPTVLPRATFFILSSVSCLLTPCLLMLVITIIDWTLSLDHG